MSLVRVVCNLFSLFPGCGDGACGVGNVAVVVHDVVLPTVAAIVQTFVGVVVVIVVRGVRSLLHLGILLWWRKAVGGGALLPATLGGTPRPPIFFAWEVKA